MSDCIDHNQSSRTYGKGLKSKGFRNSHLHRQVFFETYGYLPKVVRHACDNRRCINPKHLLAGTQQENMQDRVIRKRSPLSQPTKRKLTFQEAQEIRRQYDRGSISMVALAKKFMIAPSQIYNIIQEHTYVIA